LPTPAVGNVDEDLVSGRRRRLMHLDDFDRHLGDFDRPTSPVIPRTRILVVAQP
jgi:hypothetical protein